MNTFAETISNPGGIISWLVVGLVVGFLAGFMKRGGYGLTCDMLMGLIGAVTGGFLCGLFAGGTAGAWGSVLVAFLGGCILIAIVRVVAYAGART